MTFPHPLPTWLLQPPESAPPSLSLRVARAGDRALLYHACYAHYSPPAFADSFRRMLREQAAGRLIQLVAETPAAGAIGSGRLVRYTPLRAEIAELAVTAAWRGRGVGTALVEVLARIARTAGFRKLEIGVEVGNRRALALYLRLGFRPLRAIQLPAGSTARILVRELTAIETLEQ